MLKKLKNIVEPIIGYGIVAIILMIIISVLSIFGGRIMLLFGFEYNSIGSIILFFSIVALIGFPIETVALALPKALLSLDKITMELAKVLFVILDTISTMITMYVVDHFMNSVSSSGIAIFVIAFMMAVTSMKDLEEFTRENIKEE
ncbi:MAG: regulatory YrvL family protein [Cellulosilyticaceae bacterium]